jgi:hypothetical protein
MVRKRASVALVLTAPALVAVAAVAGAAGIREFVNARERTAASVVCFMGFLVEVDDVEYQHFLG